MPERTYRLNLYTPADFEAQIKSFETMAGKGWQLERYGPHLLTYRKAEPCETHYTMTFLRDKPIKGIEQASKHRTLSHAHDQGWELVCDHPTLDLQILCNTQLNPAPIEDNPSIIRRQTALFLRKQHLRHRIFFLLLPLLVFLFFSNDGLSPLRMVALPAFFWPYALLTAGILYSALEILWFILWRLFRIPSCTVPRLLLRLAFVPLYVLTLYAVCTAGLRMIAFLLLTAIVTLLALLSHQLLKRKFRESRALAAPMFVLLIAMFSLFMADVVINLYIEEDSLLTLSETPAPITFSDLGYQTKADGPYVSHSPVADYMIYGHLDAATSTYVYYEVCTIPSKPLRDLIVRAAEWTFWMEPTTPDPGWAAQASYTVKPNVFNANCLMICKDDTLLFLYGLPKQAADHILISLQK